MTGKLIDEWFPVAAVDEACGNPAGSGRNEKAIFTWFASRPIAQARAAVLCSLLPVDGEPSDELISEVERAVRTGDGSTLRTLAGKIPDDTSGKRPVVLDCFSGRGILPLEAARLGLRAHGLDNSPVATLASRILVDYLLRDWATEPDIRFGDAATGSQSGVLFDPDGDPRVIRDARAVLSEIDRIVLDAVKDLYPPGPGGTLPWGYLWAITIPCDQCRRRFPIVGSLVLRHPYQRTNDPGQSYKVTTDSKTGTWGIEIHDGPVTGTPTFRTAGGRGKSAWCPFDGCGHQHPLDTVKAKGFAGEYEDAPLLAADIVNVPAPGSTRGATLERKEFRALTTEERDAATRVKTSELNPIGDLAAIPTESIAEGNKDSVRATGYGYATWGELHNARQAVVLAETARAIHDLPTKLTGQGCSTEYAAALAGIASAILVRGLKHATRGAKLRSHGKAAGTQQNRCQIDHIFSDESKVSFNFDWFETGLGSGPGTWSSLTETGLKPMSTHCQGLTDLARPGKFRQGTARSLPYRDQTIDAVVTDPPYYSMIDYADVSDLFYVWLRRALHHTHPDLFGTPGGPDGLQDKSEELIVKRGGQAVDDHRTVEWYETEMGTAFAEMRRVLKNDGTLTVVFGHSDPDAWRRLLGALRIAGFVVTSAWPARTEPANTGVASIKVTVTIGCRVAPPNRPTATAAQVEREIIDLVRKRVPKWDEWNLALSDQRMAAYGPAMQVVGRYSRILRPDGTEPDLDHFLTVGRRAVADAHSFKIDDLPLDTFDAHTRFALFWLRAFGRNPVNKGEARFEAQAAELRIDELKSTILTEGKAGYTLNLDPVDGITSTSPAIHVARALAAEWATGGTDAAASVLVSSDRDPEDVHTWGAVSELVRRLPSSSELSKALTACQRNRNAITALARRTREASEQLTIDTDGELQ